MKEPFKISCLVTSADGPSGKIHQHSTWEDLARCVGGREIAVMVTGTPDTPKAPVTAPMAAPAASPVRPVAPVAPAAPETGVTVKHKTALPTANQLYRVGKLGGSWRDATVNNREEISQLIRILEDPNQADGFKLPEGPGFHDEEWDLYPMEVSWRRDELPAHWASPYTWFDAVSDSSSLSDELEPAPAPIVRPPTLTTKSKLDKMLPLLESIPDGYYGIDLTGEEKRIYYLRVDRPTSGVKKGSIKIQKIHGDRLEDAWVKWPSGKISVYTHSIEELILALMTDHLGALRRYARTINRCCRCRKRLTDERSRHYGIGPECEKYMPEIIVLVDLENSMD